MNSCFRTEPGGDSKVGTDVRPNSSRRMARELRDLSMEVKVHVVYVPHSFLKILFNRGRTETVK